MSDLLLTLGHNSSACAIKDGRVRVGFETERITLKKSESAFPAKAILRCQEYNRHYDTAFVTHWNVTNEVDKMSPKHWHRAGIPAKTIITQEQLGLTHHDTHAWAAMAFAGSTFPVDNTQVLVVDGFGNFGEHISIYDVTDSRQLKLRVRFFGYNTSIGLMYQYATNFLGMKMHEDEYKLLGYQSKFADYLGEEADAIATEAIQKIMRMWLKGLNGILSSAHDPMISLDALPLTAELWYHRFAIVCKIAGITDTKSEEARVLIAHIAQSVAEEAIRHLVSLYNPKNLVVSGGVFFNVAVNAMLARVIPGKLCAYPLAGDQGNALGLKHFYTGDVVIDNLFWGWRHSEMYSGHYKDVPGLYYVTNLDEARNLALEALEKTGFFNLVRGDMEFGPRALCNTSTIAKADNMDIVNEINRINGRNTVMPFAPVVTPEIFKKHFVDSDKLWRSQNFMITALECKDWKWPGASLVTMDGRQTCRPQVYESKSDDLVSDLLTIHPVLINTSFNVHGVPIVLDYDHIIASHQAQHRHNPNVITIVMD